MQIPVSNAHQASIPRVVQDTVCKRGDSLIDRIVSKVTAPEKKASHVDLHCLRNKIANNKDDISELKAAVKRIEAQLISEVSDRVCETVKFIDGLPLQSHNHVLSFFVDDNDVKKLTSFALALLHSHDSTTLREVIDRVLQPKCTFCYIWPGDK